MKKAVYIVVLVLFVQSLVSAQTIKKVKITDVLHMVDTASVPLVVNFWASWCPPCVHELPYFEKQITNFKGAPIKLVLVSLDYAEDYPKVIANFIKKNKYQSEALWLNETDPNYFCAKVDRKWDGAIPVTLMVNNKTQYRQFYPEQLTENQLKMALQKLVE